MNKLKLAIIALFVINIGFITYYFLKDSGKQKIVFVDIIKVFNGFNFKAERQVEYERQKAFYQGKLDTLELDFTATQKALEISGNKVLEQRLNNTAEYYQQMEYAYQVRLDSTDKKFNDEIWTKINVYVQDYGKEKKYDMIVGASGTGSLMYGDVKYDVTEDVLAYINNKYEGQ